MYMEMMIDMNKTLKSIDLVCENCEAITIDSQYIGNWNIENITESLYGNLQEILNMTICDNFEIALNRNGNKENHIVSTDNYERILTYKDITSIVLNYTNGSSNRIYLPWEDDTKEYNGYMICKKNKFGDLFISVNKDKKSKWDDESINNADSLAYFLEWDNDSQKG